jgi:hypothetical protein
MSSPPSNYSSKENLTHMDKSTKRRCNNAESSGTDLDAVQDHCFLQCYLAAMKQLDKEGPCTRSQGEKRREPAARILCDDAYRELAVHETARCCPEAELLISLSSNVVGYKRPAHDSSFDTLHGSCLKSGNQCHQGVPSALYPTAPSLHTINQSEQQVQKRIRNEEALKGEHGSFFCNTAHGSVSIPCRLCTLSRSVAYNGFCGCDLRILSSWLKSDLHCAFFA